MKYIYGDIELYVDGDGILQSMVNKTGQRKDVVISNEPTKGCVIRGIGSNFCRGTYGNIYINSSIGEIQNHAFMLSDVEHVHWPNNYKNIPKSCFEASSLKKITGIAYITEIGEKAFANSAIAHIDWPVNCTEIPTRCFYNSELKSIVGTGNVIKIGDNAFHNSEITSLTNVSKVQEIGEKAFAYNMIADFKWPSACKIIPKECFMSSKIKQILNLDNVVEIGASAFVGARSLKKLDLSSSLIATIGEDAFNGIGRGRVLMPYYMSKEEVNNLFAPE